MIAEDMPLWVISLQLVSIAPAAHAGRPPGLDPQNFPIDQVIYFPRMKLVLPHRSGVAQPG